MTKVVYLTGAPAAGKSSTTRLLSERIPHLLVWEYGARLTERLRARLTAVSDQTALRAMSASVVTPDDVTEVDRSLVEFVCENRADHNILIDSHAVTKEAYGYRVTAFGFEQVRSLGPDEIWVLYADPAETRRRISADDGGRPTVSEEEARLHTALQASVAATYGVTVGCPVYLFDTSGSRDDLVARLAERLLS